MSRFCLRVLRWLFAPFRVPLALFRWFLLFSAPFLLFFALCGARVPGYPAASFLVPIGAVALAVAMTPVTRLP